MEKFKYHILIHSITDSLMSGRPLSGRWGFPEFISKTPAMLEALFGAEAYDIYKDMNDDEKINARNWFETHGIEAEMYRGELYENWDDSKPAKYDLTLFKAAHADIYRKVVIAIVDQAYSYYSENIRDIIVKKFYDEPTALEQTLKDNVKL